MRTERRLISILRLRERQVLAAEGRLAATARQQSALLQASRGQRDEALRIGGELCDALQRGVACDVATVALARSRAVDRSFEEAQRAEALEPELKALRESLREAKQRERSIARVIERRRSREALRRARREARVLDEAGQRAGETG